MLIPYQSYKATFETRSISWNANYAAVTSNCTRWLHK